MSDSDFGKSQADHKQEAFFSEQDKPLKKKKKIDKPFLVQAKYKEASHAMFQFLLEWSCRKKFETVELAQKYVDKLKREAYSDRKEFRILELREGTEHVVD